MPAQKHTTPRIVVTIPAADLARWTALAAAAGMTRNAWILEACRAAEKKVTPAPKK